MTVIIGSGRLAHMRLDHPDIELAHVKVAWDDVGISMVDNGSRKGTWVNGEPVETAALLDGDVIEFVAPGSKSTPPKVKIRIPKGRCPSRRRLRRRPEELARAPGAGPAGARAPRAGAPPRRGFRSRPSTCASSGSAAGASRAPRRRLAGSRSGSTSPLPRSTRSRPRRRSPGRR